MRNIERRIRKLEQQARNEDEFKRQVDALVNECRFAQLIETADGPAIFIGGSVINVSSSDDLLHAAAIVKALRRGSGSRQQEHEPAPPPIPSRPFNSFVCALTNDVGASRTVSAGGTGAARTNFGLGSFRDQQMAKCYSAPVEDLRASQMPR